MAKRPRGHQNLLCLSTKYTNFSNNKPKNTVKDTIFKLIDQKQTFFIHVQTSFYYETKLIHLHHAMLLNTISDQAAAATLKSKVLFVT